MTSATPKMYEIDKKEATFRPQIMKIVASMAVLRHNFNVF